MADEVEIYESVGGPQGGIPYETMITVIYYAESTEEAHKLAQDLGTAVFGRDFVEQVEVEKAKEA